ncbi:NAD(P)-binding domain [Dillenia turbinata]|uniref:NAD(P)-binding domain n=1 Tax=Dillenia turbinata TaxID=194707 RepID=A0AAN8VIQ7_9MAGN
MAPALTSNNSFLLSTTPRSTSRLYLRNPRVCVFAKKSGTFPSFWPGNKSEDTNNTSEEPSNSSPFNFKFNFGNGTEAKSLIPIVNNPSTGFTITRRKDPGTVFVAGATGQAGTRIAQKLLREGFRVRAGVPELDSAQELARLAAQYKIISAEESKRLNAVESTFGDAVSIAKAIGNASKVVVTIGPAENGPTAEVTPVDALQVVQAAQLAGVGHVAIICNAETMNASTYNVIDGIQSFFNNFFSQSQPLSIPEFIQKLVETDVRYTLIKTRLTEDFSPESSYNVVVSVERKEGAAYYKVAKSQIASLVASVFSNTAIAENKVVEVSTSPSAPSKSVVELFSVIPEDGRRKAYAEALAKAKAEDEAFKASEKARKAAEAAKKFKEEVKKLSQQEAEAASLAEAAREKAEAAGASVERLLSKAKGLSSGFSWEKFSSQLTTAVPKPEEKPKVQIATVRGQAKAQTLPAKKAIVKPPSLKVPSLKPRVEPKPKPKQTESKPPEVRKVFGGLFQQETIYVDDD